MFVSYFVLFPTLCDSVIVDDDHPSTVGNDGSEFSVGENTIRSETGDASATESSNLPMLGAKSSTDKRLSVSDFVVSTDNTELSEFERMSAETGTAEVSVGISEHKIPMHV